MAARPSTGTLSRLWRFYQAAIVNTAFGYGLFALLLSVGFNMYLAQVVAHLLGMAFNFFTYSRHAFHDSEASKLRFVLSYAVNYGLGLALLWAASHVIPSPYVAGLIALVVVSLLNYLILRHFVFVARRPL